MAEKGDGTMTDDDLRNWAVTIADAISGMDGRERYIRCAELLRVVRERIAADYHADLAAAQDACRSLAARCAGQSELLTMRADRVAEVEPVSPASPEHVPPPGWMGQPVTVTYTNWKGETRTRRILPVRLWHGTTQWHPEPGWLLEAKDVDDPDGRHKDFAMCGIKVWGGTVSE